MSAHTPTPWLREGCTVYALESAGRRKGVEEFRNRLTVGVSARTKEEAEASAEFIVRAVNAHEDLLEALCWLVPADARDCDACERCEGTCIAHAAIAKATGSPPEDEARLQRVRASMDADDAVARKAPCPECGALPQEDCIETRSRMRLAHCHSGRRTAALRATGSQP